MLLSLKVTVLLFYRQCITVILNVQKLHGSKLMIVDQNRKRSSLSS